MGRSRIFASAGSLAALCFALLAGCGEDETRIDNADGDTASGSDVVTPEDTASDPASCVGKLPGAACDDGDPCTVDDACDDGLTCGGTNKACDDRGVCSAGGCDPGTGECVYADTPDGTDCADELTCFEAATCQGGRCIADASAAVDCGPPPADDPCAAVMACKPGVGCVPTYYPASAQQRCDLDDDPCTIDLCAGEAGCQPSGDEVDCSHLNTPCQPVHVCNGKPDEQGNLYRCVPADPGGMIGESCPPEDPCDQAGTCQLVNDRVSCVSDPLVTDRAGDCWSDWCEPPSEAGGQATIHHEPLPAGSDCEHSCGIAGKCDGAGVCTPPAGQCCNDADCLAVVTGTCAGTAYCALDGDGVGTCALDTASATGCDAFDEACRDAVCDPGDGECHLEDLADGLACDDGDACTDGDACDAGVCAGGAITCDDHDVCTDDSCEPATGCVYTDNVAPCDDGDGCTTGDICGAGTCAGAPIAGCECDATEDCAALEDGDRCNGTLMCDVPAGKCVDAPDSAITCALPDGVDSQCNAPTCAPDTGACGYEAAREGEGCDDADGCTASDLCGAGTCGGTPIDGCECDDDDDCGTLEDGDLCNGTLVCDVLGGGKCIVDYLTVISCALPPHVSPSCSAPVCAADTGACSFETTSEAGCCGDDSDGDGVVDAADNCVSAGNADQYDSDGDGAGDPCDAFPDEPGEHRDSDGDGVGDGADCRPWDPGVDAPSCDGRACGPDGCGGVCGECGTAAYCTVDGQCEAVNVQPAATVTGVVELDAISLDPDRAEPDMIAWPVAALDESAVTLGTDAVVGLAPGDEVLLLNVQGTTSDHERVGTAGLYVVADVVGGEVTLSEPIRERYATPGNGDLTGQRVNLIRVPRYAELVVSAGATVTASAWNGTKGGVLAFSVAGQLTLEEGAAVSMASRGYRGGAYGPKSVLAPSSGSWGAPGEGVGGPTSSRTYVANVNGGGGGRTYWDGTGDWGDPGAAGSNRTKGAGYSSSQAGARVGWRHALQLLMGGGGGGGGADGKLPRGSDEYNGVSGRAGGGVVFVQADALANDGLFRADGGASYSQCVPGSTSHEAGGGGAGAGGTVFLAAPPALPSREDCSFFNAPILGREGALAEDADGAVCLDGVDQAIVCSARSKLGSNRAEHTISAWFRSSSDAADQFIYSETPGDGANDAMIAVVLNSSEGGAGRLTYIVRAADGVNTRVLHSSSAATLNDGAWHHVAALRLGNLLYLYVDGVAHANSADTTSTYNDRIAGPLDVGATAIGARAAFPTPQTGFFEGELDEVALYGHALHGDYIAELYLTGAAGPSEGHSYAALMAEEPPIAWYRLGQLTGPLAENEAGTFGGLGAVYVAGGNRHDGCRCACSARGGAGRLYLAATAEDVDGDTVRNELDGCPIDPDAGQLDIDADLVGDVCDDTPANVEDLDTGLVASIGTLGEGGRTWSTQGVAGRYGLVVVDRTFAAGQDFEVVLASAQAYRGVGMVYGPAVHHSQIDGYAANPTGPTWGALSDTGFPYGFDGGFVGKAQAPAGSAATQAWFKLSRRYDTLAVASSTVGPDGPWSDVVAAVVAAPEDQVVLGYAAWDDGAQEVAPLALVTVRAALTAPPVLGAVSVDGTTGWHGSLGVISEDGRTWDGTDVYLAFESVVLGHTFAPGEAATLLTTWGRDFMNLGAVHGASVSHTAFGTWSADASGPYWASMETTGFPQGYPGSWYGATSAISTTDTDTYWLKSAVGWGYLTLQFSPHGPLGPWTDLVAPAPLPASDRVVFGFGKLGDDEPQPLTLERLTTLP